LVRGKSKRKKEIERKIVRKTGVVIKKKVFLTNMRKKIKEKLILNRLSKMTNRPI